VRDFIRKTKKKIKNYSFIIDFWRRLVTTLLYIKICEYCKYKTSLVRTNIHFREQYYAFGNQLEALIKKSFVFENFMCKYAVEIGVNNKMEQ